MESKNRSESEKIHTHTHPSQGLSYREAGVDISREEASLGNFIKKYMTKTFQFVQHGPGEVLSSIGYFANIIRITDTMGLAVSADGVGTKVLIAQMMNKYDTIGIDCMAMNVNDIICVGAKPVSFLDYIALQEPHEDLLDQLGQGLLEGARQAKVTIPGGETAQVRDLIQGVRPGYGFDIAGMGIGTLDPRQVIEGSDLDDGDIIAGLASSGLHSNGYSLARKIFFGKGAYKVDSSFAELQKTLGEELLTPTVIYVPAVNELLAQDLRIKALINITGDGLLNLLRVKADVKFSITSLPEPPPIFPLMQQLGRISDDEMFRTFNMGVGFCVLVHPDDFDSVRTICNRFGIACSPIGTVEKSPEKRVDVVSKKLRGVGRSFYKI
ncbi:MAG: phosphoribosylformylglycinamidine cyclo-ligase [bacterium]